MSRSLRGWGALLAGAAALASAAPALALWDDRLELFAAETVSHDDNVFRLSSGVDPAAVLGTSSRDDTYFTTSVGFNLDVPVSWQRVQLHLALIDTRYERFKVLDLDHGHDAGATWWWRAGGALNGQLGYTDTLALGSLANTQSGLLSGTPSVLRTEKAFLNATLDLAPRWRLLEAASRLQQSNQAATLRFNDVNINRVDLTASYVTPENNQFGIGVGVETGQFPERQLVGGTPIDNAYRQQRAAVVADWTISGHSQVRARVGRVSRDYEQLPQRDVDSATYRVAWDWKPTASVAMNATAQRDIGPLDDFYARSVLSKGFALRPAYSPTERTGVAGLLEVSDRTYLGDPAEALGVVPPRVDRVQIAALSLTYQPARRIAMELALRRESRSSTVAYGDYVANIVSASLRIGL